MGRPPSSALAVAWSSTVRKRDETIWRQRQQLILATNALNSAYRDYEEIMKRLAPPQIAPHVTVHDMMITNEGRITVHYDPVHMAFSYQEQERDYRLGGTAQDFVDHAAAALASEHSKQVQRAISDNLNRILKRKRTA